MGAGQSTAKQQIELRLAATMQESRASEFDRENRRQLMRVRMCVERGQDDRARTHARDAVRAERRCKAATAFSHRSARVQGAQSHRVFQAQGSRRAAGPRRGHALHASAS